MQTRDKIKRHFDLAEIIFNFKRVLKIFAYL